MLDESRTHPHRPEQIGFHQTHGRCVVERPARVVEGHDSRVVDDHVQRRIPLDQLLCHRPNLLRVADIEFDCVDFRVLLRDLVEQRFAASRYDHLVAACAERLRKCAADTRCAARDKYRVSSEFHDSISLSNEMTCYTKVQLASQAAV
jgi:hypothetical protein